MAYLELDRVTKRFRSQTVLDAISLQMREGEMLCLLGPSGCGKTTTLRLIAGFDQPDAGVIRLGGLDVTRMPAEQRDIGVVFQNYALFPHLTVRENVGFGLRMRRRPKHEIAKMVSDALDLVQLPGVADRLPRQLSGGQQQRVALARAIVIRPRLLLLDEPLSNLDASLRDAMREEIRRVQRMVGITALFVTHDQTEALAVADRMAVMQAGRIMQLDTPEQVYRNPANPFVAGFIGQANLLPGHVLEIHAGAVAMQGGDGLVLQGYSEANLTAGSPALAVIKADRVRLSSSAEGDTCLPLTVDSAVFLGPTIAYGCSMGTIRLSVVASSAALPKFVPGETAFASWSPRDCLIVAG